MSDHHGVKRMRPRPVTGQPICFLCGKGIDPGAFFHFLDCRGRKYIHEKCWKAEKGQSKEASV